MMNIKDCGFGYPKTFKNILDYDKHSDKYKSENNVVKDDQKFNICLVDNTQKFEQNLKKYHKDLYFANSQNRIKARHKTNAQIERDFYKSKIMKTFRIQVNSIELRKINQGILDPEKIRENTTAFYQKTLDQAIAILDHENSQKRQPLMVVKADVHFDQTNPHIHIHLSNLYERKVKENRYDQEHKKLVITNNVLQSDLIGNLTKISENLKNQKELKVSPNEIFTRLLNQSNNNQYLFLNRLHLKTAYPKFFSLYESNTWKKLDIDFKNLSQKEIQKQISQIKGKWWKQDKQKYFSQINTLILKMDLIDPLEINNIKNARVFNELINYTFKMQMYQTLKSLGINEQIQIQKFMQSDELFKFTVLQKDKIIQPNELLFKFSNEKFKLSKYDPSLKNIEQKIREIKTQELVQYFQYEYKKVQKELNLENEQSQIQTFKKEALTMSLNQQQAYVKQTCNLLNQTQQLGFENLFSLIVSQNNLQKIDLHKPLQKNIEDFYQQIQFRSDDEQKRINNQLIDALNLATKLEFQENDLNQFKLEKSQDYKIQNEQQTSVSKQNQNFDFEYSFKLFALNDEVQNLEQEILNEQEGLNFENAFNLERKRDDLIQKIQELTQEADFNYSNKSNINSKSQNLNQGYQESPFYEQVAVLFESNANYDFDYEQEYALNKQKASQLSSLERAWHEQALRQTNQEHEQNLDFNQTMKRR